MDKAQTFYANQRQGKTGAPKPAQPQAFAASFSDLSGPLNPTGRWSPAYIKLTQALTNNLPPDAILQALYSYLASNQVAVTPQQVERIVRTNKPDAAYAAILKLMGGKGMNMTSLPAAIQQTLKQAVQHLAGQVADRAAHKAHRSTQQAAALRKRYNAESVVNLMLER